MIRVTSFIKLIFVSFHVVVGVVTCTLIFPISSKKVRMGLIRKWAQLLLFYLRVRVETIGELPDFKKQTYILTSNHISWVDIFVIHSLHPVRFVSKSEVRHWPVFGWLADKSGTLFLQRQNRRATQAIGNDMVYALREGDSLGLFPESTTSNGQQILPFKSSMLQPAVSEKTPFLPIAIRYYLSNGKINPYIPFVGDMNFVSSLLGVVKSPQTTVKVAIGHIITPVDVHRRELAQILEKDTQTLLHEVLK
ncbi:MAG: 1-acyl-sn-glycerol-3-phosphate acyltransferase [Ferrovum sp. 34-44-207]|nr:1-acyl-sn-glycerol-3-phosphate acyltransferase [Ferrovum sp. JA12]OZB34507.1 MAG: 1-acyl-sn-glycerol-3-phosphate acyltransferase [Ferrovum sp. 34-44-207]